MTNPKIGALLKRWKDGVDKPFKGALIDMDAYREKPSLGCMCAQGQVLVEVGSVNPLELIKFHQNYADRAVAELLGISVGHAALLRVVNDTVDGAPFDVLDAPEKVLGPNAPLILAFWRHLDRMKRADWETLGMRLLKIKQSYGPASWGERGLAAETTATFRPNALAYVQRIHQTIVEAVRELERMEPGEACHWLPLFGFADPDALMQADAKATGAGRPS